MSNQVKMKNEKLDRESICWSLTDGLTETYLYPEDINRIVDGLKVLKKYYTKTILCFTQANMPHCRNHVRNVLGDINSLIKLLGGDPDDNSLSDSSLQD